MKLIIDIKYEKELWIVSWTWITHGLLEISQIMWENQNWITGANLNSEEKAREWQRKINDIKLLDMGYIENYTAGHGIYRKLYCWI